MLFSTASRPGTVCIYCACHSQRLQRQYARIQRAGYIAARGGDTNSRFKSSSKNNGEPRPVGRREDQPRVSFRPLKGQHNNKPQRHSERPSDRNNSSGQLVRQQGTGHLNWVKNESLAEAINRRLKVLQNELKDAPLLEKLKRDSHSQRKSGDDDHKSFNKVWQRFCDTIFRDGNEGKVPLGRKDGQTGEKRTKTVQQSLRDAFSSRGDKGLDARIKYEFYGYLLNARFTASDVRNQQTLADLRYPSEWFPATRAVHREIHLHVGPTNSGKTYHALQRLEQAETGVYAGPLRLLAHEVYSRLNAKGKACALITGEERRAAVDEEGDNPFAMMSCTVEMIPLTKAMDVAVIDEIQMIGNMERGWAWTQALLGVRAREVHLCGEERTVPLVKQICASLGEELKIHHYKRLSPLEVAGESLDGELSKLRKGDCIVSFTVMGIHSLRKQIERVTGKKVAIVYGGLPPETRAQQARLFNDPNNDYDYLVASDAVGMGLNLAIKRIIFETASKYNGYQQHQLAVADIKQIAGRAGRYRTAAQAMQQMNKSASQEEVAITAKGDIPPPSADSPVAVNDTTGYVTTLREFDYPLVSAAMSAEPEPILTAGVHPPAVVIERFAGYFPPGTPFSYILTRLHELSQMHSRFHLCGLRDQVYVADLIEPIEGLTIADRHNICACPASATDHKIWGDLLPALARCIANQSGGDILDIAEMPLEVLDADVSPSREYLRALEGLHKGIVGYLWLSFRFAGIFGQRPLAQHIKSLVEEKIEKVLGSFSFSEAAAKKIAEKREQLLLREMEAAIAGKTNAEDGEVENYPVMGESRLRPTEGANGEGMEIAGEFVQEQESLPPGGDRFGGEVETDIEDEAYLDDGEDLETDPNPFDRGQDRHATSNATVSKIEEAADETQHGNLQESTEIVSPKSADGNSEAGYNQFGGVPPKHLKHLETNITELERNVHSRP